MLLTLLVMIPALAGIHWYLWIRLVRDVSAPAGWYRRAGTAALVAFPLLSLLAMLGARLPVSFGVRRALAWPGDYWSAVLLYLLLPLLAGELLRPLLLRRLRTRAAAPGTGPGPAAGAGVAERRRPEPVSARGAAVAAGGDAGRQHAPGPTTAAAPPRDAGRPGARLGPDPAAGEAAEVARRRFVARAVGTGAALVSGGTVAYGTYAARRLTTRHVTVTLDRLPRAAHGYRIAVVSDIHLGPLLGASHCRRVVDAVNRTRPDLVTVVGDLVDAEVPELRSAAAPLAGLRARDGCYFVTGNHEYRVDTGEWLGHVRELGLRPLENARAELPYFDLAGVNDLAGEGTGHGGPDFEAALGDRDTRRAAVLMAHQPVQIHDAADYGVGLQLSGHSHGGQLWPGGYLAELANPTVAGLERYGDTQLYVTRGAGTSGPPVRVGADPDVTLISLASGRA